MLITATLLLACFHGPQTPHELPAAILGHDYSVHLAARGGEGVLRWLHARELPPGLALSPDGELAGVPTRTGEWTFDVTVTDELGDRAGPREYGLKVVAPPARPVRVLTEELATGWEGIEYYCPLSASGGLPPYRWILAEGRLPAGLRLEDGDLRGTPEGTGRRELVLTVQDDLGSTSTSERLILVVEPGPIHDELVIETRRLPTAFLGVPYEAPLVSTGGWRPVRWTIGDDTLPEGLSLEHDRILGVPAVLGEQDLELLAVDQRGATASRTIALLVAEVPGRPAPRAAIDRFPPAFLKTPYRAVIPVEGGRPPHAIEMRGAPSWARVEGPTLEGEPTETGRYDVEVAVRDADGRGEERQLELVVEHPPFVEPLHLKVRSLPRAWVGRYYRASVQVAGGVPPYRFEPVRLDLGFELTSAGWIAGRAVETGRAELPITVTDALGTRASFSDPAVVEVAAEREVPGRSGPSFAKLLAIVAVIVAATLGTWFGSFAVRRWGEDVFGRVWHRLTHRRVVRKRSEDDL